MSFNFPNSPTEGQEFVAVPDGATYIFKSGQWILKSIDAPQDGKLYGRKNVSWVEVSENSFPDAPADSKLYGRKNNAWVEITFPTPPPPVSISDTAPSSPVVGQLWFDSSTGGFFVYYNDGTSSQWVQVNSMAG